jgi:murein DD-endopeptidase MepM/ murein hydrolase activator NlpD
MNRSALALALVVLATAPAGARTVPQPAVPAFSWPVCVSPIAGFGFRQNPFTNAAAFHTGIDLKGALGAPVRAAAPGRIAFAENRGASGLVIEIDHGNGYRTRYGHLESFAVQAGDQVGRGQVIAAIGSTGQSTGPHLHFEVSFKDVAHNPRKHLERTPCGGSDVPAGPHWGQQRAAL